MAQFKNNCLDCTKVIRVSISVQFDKPAQIMMVNSPFDSSAWGGGDNGNQIQTFKSPIFFAIYIKEE